MTSISAGSPLIAQPAHPTLTLGAARSWWQYHRQHRQLKQQVRGFLGSEAKRGDVRRTRWLVARAGFSFTALGTLTPLERSQLRRDLSVDGVTVALWIYWLIIVSTASIPIIVHPAAETVDQATYMAFAAGTAALAIVTQIVDSVVVWIRARWGSADRQLGLITRSALVVQARLDRGASTRLWIRRTALSDVRALVVQLDRADCDPHAAAPVIADLRERADARPAWRELMLRHRRGDLVEVRVQIPATSWTALGDLLPRWATVLSFFVTAVGLLTAVKELT